MQVNLEGDIAHYRIHAYDNSSVTIAIPKQIESVPENHEDGDIKLHMWRDTLQASLVLMPDRLIRDWTPHEFEQLDKQDFTILTEYQLEIVLLGTGKTLQRPPAAILAPLIDAGIGIEIMDTGAACRTYNILVADQRCIAVALLI